MTILGILLLAAAVMAYVSYPLWTSEPTAQAGGRKSRPKAGLESTPVSAPAPTSDADELELDRQIGRLDEQDYAVLRGTRPADSTKASVGQGHGEDNEDDEIERRVRALRQERARRTQSKGQEH